MINEQNEEKEETVESTEQQNQPPIFESEDFLKVLEHIEKEYRKEFYAEGQLWYFYKRLGYETFLYCPVSKMNESNYRFAIPDDETILGNIN